MIFLIFLLRHFRRAGYQAFEKIIEGIVVGQLVQIHAAVIGLAAGRSIFIGLDIDHGSALLLHQFGEVGYQHIYFIFRLNLLRFFRWLFIIVLSAILATVQSKNGGHHHGQVFMSCFHCVSFSDCFDQTALYCKQK